MIISPQHIGYISNFHHTREVSYLSSVKAKNDFMQTTGSFVVRELAAIDRKIMVSLVSECEILSGIYLEKMRGTKMTGWEGS